jgi:hypothetical protein
MYMIFTVLACFFFYLFFLYLFSPPSKNKLLVFDISALSVFFYLLISRIFWFVFGTGLSDLRFSALPFVENNGVVEYFTTLPWVFLRIFDSNYDFRFPLLSFIFILYLLRLFLRKNFRGAYIDRSFLVFLGCYLAFLVFMLFTNQSSVFTRDLSLLSLNSVVIEMIIIFVIGLIYIAISSSFPNIHYYPILFFVYGLLSVLLRIAKGEYVPILWGIDIYYAEACLCLVVSFVYYVKLNLRRGVDDKQTLRRDLRSETQENALKFDRDYDLAKLQEMHRPSFANRRIPPNS